jgi:hypothetical protein
MRILSFFGLMWFDIEVILSIENIFCGGRLFGMKGQECHEAQLDHRQRTKQSFLNRVTGQKRRLRCVPNQRNLSTALLYTILRMNFGRGCVGQKRVECVNINVLLVI